MYPSSSILEVDESPRIIHRRILSDSPTKLSEINEITANTTGVRQNSGDEADYGQGADDFVGEARDSVGVLHVRLDNQDSFGGSANVGFR